MAKQLIKTSISPIPTPTTTTSKLKINKYLFYARMSLTKTEKASKINKNIKTKMAESIFLFANCFSSSRT